MIDLKLCPFCGYEGRIFGAPKWGVTCNDGLGKDEGCGASVDGFDSPDEAAFAWNTRTEGRESRASGEGLRPGDIAWLERAKDTGHCGEGSMESKSRHDHNERIDRLLAALSLPREAWKPVGEAGDMPGSNGGFTMAAFRAVDVPKGSKLYIRALPSAPPAATRPDASGGADQ